MANKQLSPGIQTSEKDFTGNVNAISTSGGAFAGVFSKGPMEEAITVTSVTELEEIFGQPNISNRADFLLASQFLRRSQNLKVIRINTSGSKNATADGTGITSIKNFTDYQENYEDSQGNFGTWVSKTPGKWGNSLKVSICPADSTAFDAWTYKTSFRSQPLTSPFASARGASLDELHIVVIDEDGKISGTPDTVLERYEYLSQASDAKDEDNNDNYYKNVINSSSQYVYWSDHPTELTNAGDAVSNTTFSVSTSAIEDSLGGGVSTDTATIAEYLTGYQIFENDDEIDFDIMFTPPLPNGIDGTTLANNLISIAESRKDFFLCISPPVEDTVGVASISQQKTNVIEFLNSLTPTSYASCDTTAVYIYDKYNNGGSYTYIPGSANFASNLAFTVQSADIATPPAGTRRGQYLGVSKISYNPNKAHRGELFQARGNPIITKPGKGTFSFGDRTLVARSSVFDQISVRRVFIFLREAITNYAENFLFEKNNQITRIIFKNGIRPFLENSVSDEIIEGIDIDLPVSSDPNEFIGNFRIAPIYSTRYINLNFIAVRSASSLQFTESVATDT